MIISRVSVSFSALSCACFLFGFYFTFLELFCCLATFHQIHYMKVYFVMASVVFFVVEHFLFIDI